MTLVILFLRTRKNYLADYGTFALVVLFFCCIVRMFIPIEFPKHQFIIHNTFIYNHILKPFLTISIPDWVLYLVLALWLIGSIIVFFRLFRQASKTEHNIVTESSPAPAIVVQTLRALDPDGTVDIRMSSNIIVAILTGFFHPVIYLPDKEYTEEELKYILLHEYTHYQRKDIWKKLFFNALYVIFWWNPFIYILRHEASDLIEFHCDQQLARQLNEWEVVDYLQILRDNVERIQDSSTGESPATIGFVYKTKEGTTKQRFRLLLNRTAKSRTSIIPKVLILIFAIVWMIVSYYVILQTDYATPTEELWNSNIATVATSENAYLEEQDDGSYLFYFYGEAMEVPKEDVEAGMYDIYPIYNQPDKSSILSMIKQWIKNIKPSN